MLDINRHAGGVLAGSWGQGQHFQRVRIEGDEFTFILDVHIDVPVAIGLRGLRLAAEWDTAHNLARAGIDGRCVFRAATIESENTFARGIVEDSVRIFALQIEGRNDLHFLHVEDGYRTLCAEKRTVEFGSEHDGVSAMRFAESASCFPLESRTMMCSPRGMKT